MTYHSNGSYNLSCGPDLEPVEASAKLKEEGGVMVLHGYVGERQVAANVAVVGDSLHVFTVVSMCVGVGERNLCEGEEYGVCGGGRGGRVWCVCV